MWVISWIKSTPPQNRQLHTLISKSKQYVDDLTGELTSSNQPINTFCEISRLVEIKGAARPGPEVRVSVSRFQSAQGFLAHKKTPPPRTLQQEYAWGPMVGRRRGAVSDEQGTPVGCASVLFKVSGFRLRVSGVVFCVPKC